MTIRLGIASALICVLLAACGGGGDAGGGEPLPPTTYPLRAAYVNSRTDTSSRQFSGSGTVNGIPVTVSGSVAGQPLRPSTFEGRAAQARDTGMAGTVTAGGITQPLVSIATEFLSSDLMPLGSSDGEYDVLDGTANIPASVQIGSSGLMYTFARYADATKAVRIGSGSGAYSLQAGPAADATLLVTTTARGTDGAVESTTVQTFNMSPQGILTPISEEITSPTEHLVIQYGAVLGAAQAAR